MHPTKLRLIIPILFTAFSWTFANSSGDATDTPDVVSKMTQALTSSKLDHLVSKTYKEEDRKFSYHLKTIDYLGSIIRDGRQYTVAATKFIRSSAKDSNYPPARGHGFIIVFDDKFNIATYGRLDFAEFWMDGEVLKSGKEVIADLGSTDPTTRFLGWQLDSSFMPYPFSDRISETDWKSGAFRKNH
jgi:hypothetical protein